MSLATTDIWQPRPASGLRAMLGAFLGRRRKRRLVRLTELDLRALSPHVRRDLGLDP